MQNDFENNTSQSPDILHVLESDKNSTKDISRRSSLETLDVNEAILDRNESIKSAKSVMSATPKSVQFRRSVTFSDGKSMREIPLNVSTPPEVTASNYPKTPFPGHSALDNLDGESMESSSQKEAISKALQASKSVTNVPSQMKNSDLKFDPACPPKFFRPHTVGCPRSSTELLKVRDNWSKSAASRRFHSEYPEQTPDLRRKPDLRFTNNEKRHVVPEAKAHTYLFRGSDHM